MDRQIKVFNAFTGIDSLERSVLISFLIDHTDQSNPQEILQAVDYAMKNRPSFGGFILTVWENQRITGAVVANRTGMEGYNPKHLFVYATLHRERQQDERFAQELMKRAIDYADGEIAVHIKPENPVLKLYEKLGFTAQYLELRLRKPASA